MLKHIFKYAIDERIINMCSFILKKCKNDIDLTRAHRIMESIPKFLQKYWKCFITYKYRSNLTGAYRVTEKIALIHQSVRRCIVDPKKILFYPDMPLEFHAIYKLLSFLGYYITSDRKEKYDMSILWWLAFDGNPFAPEKSFSMISLIKQNGHIALNFHGRDISKALVNSTFESVFQYSLSVDPVTHVGECVMKLNWNALHKGKVIKCPVKSIDSDSVYQRIVCNEVEDGLVEDMRVPIFLNKIPFVYLKYRSIKNRFIDRVHTSLKAIIAETDDVLSIEEQKNICRFAKKMGLDYCEVDVLRDRNSGLIYIVDANNTPSGPPSPISSNDAKVAVIRLAKAFEDAISI